MLATIDNSAPVVPWSEDRGDDWVYPILKTNSPVSMSGWTWLGQIRSARGRSSTLVATMTQDVSAASSGTVVLSVPNATTETIAAGEYWYEIQKTVSGIVTTFVGGPLTVLDDTADV